MRGTCGDIPGKLVGITFDPNGALVVASNDTVYGFVHVAAAPTTAH